MRFDVATLINRVSRSREAPRDLRSSEFDQKASALLGEVELTGGSGGIAFRQAIRKLCAAELHERTEDDVAALLSIQKVTCAPPAARILMGCKDWITKRIAEDALDLTRHLWKPREARGESGEPDSLTYEVHREQISAFAALDNASDSLKRDRVERALRFAARAGQFVGTPFRAIVGGG